MKYETKETINNLALCNAWLFFVPMILGLYCILNTNSNDIIAILCILIEILSIAVMVITSEM